MVGQRIGNYAIIRKIGDGGMGSVFEALHEGIGRRAAVKVLHAKFTNDQGVVARFFNEARAVNMVQHPGIVGCFDHGQLPDGTAYIIMELLDGESLKARLRRLRRLGPDALRLCRQIAGTLSAAHQRGIVHRDLKPDNVIIVPDPEAPGGERAKILDFGIAKLIGTPEGGEAQEVTMAGTVMGTPKYMSPEQCKGAGQVDAKADVYSLGVMLFEMLGGRLPFEAEGTGALLAMHIYKPPPPLRESEPSISLQEEALVQAMLAKDPAARPTMGEVAAMLEQMGIKGTQAMPVYLPSGALSSMSLHLPQHTGHTSSPSSPSIGDTSRPSIVMAAGQSSDRTRLGRGASRFLVPGAVAAMVIAGAFFVIRPRDEAQLPVPGAATAQPAPAAPRPPARVTLTLDSTPPGATVVRDADDTVLGTTPWRMEQPAGAGQLVLTVRLRGYLDQQVAIDLGKDFSAQLTLDAEPAAAPSKPAIRPSSSRHRPAKSQPKEQKKEDEVDVAPMH